MNEGMVMDIIKNAMETMLMVAGPILLISLLVGLLVSVFQALTQINEATLSFIPKLLAIGGGLMIMGPWMLQKMMSFTTGLFENVTLYTR